MNHLPRISLKKSILATVILISLLFFLFCYLKQGQLSAFLFNWTGEEKLLPQIRGMIQLLSNFTRPRTETKPYVPIAHTGVNPFGVNTFLQLEVEPEKRERILQMVSEAGFKWIRQEFPWEDIEIYGKGDFWDHKWNKSAWEKYDNIVDLAEKYKLQIIARLDNPPAWSRAGGDDVGTLAPPDDFNDFGDFVYTIVSRYKGRIKYYQIWNEPNIYPEWGEQPVNPIAYTELLKIAYKRAKEADPNAVIISAALAPTIEVDYRNLSDVIFLQQMYDAGAKDYFDIMSIQCYGLWSGPTDRRMRPRVINFSRPLYIRDIMVKNGDENKPIWISEMNWCAVPDEIPDKRYGQVTEEQQARYATLAYQRILEEWPWVGVVNFWFFKLADDRGKDKPEYYFRMVEPDFTPMPVYFAMKEYANQFPVMYPGYHQEDHWAVSYNGNWQRIPDSRASLGMYLKSNGEGNSLSFTFKGTDLSLIVVKDESSGILSISIDGSSPMEVDLYNVIPCYQVEIPIARGLAYGKHQVRILVKENAKGNATAAIDGFIVRDQTRLMDGYLLNGIIIAGLFSGVTH